MVKVCVILGIYPRPKEMSQLVKFLANYPKFQAAEIPRAFELNSIGKHWDTIKPFGKINTILLGDILKQYRIAKRKHDKKKEARKRRSATR